MSTTPPPLNEPVTPRLSLDNAQQTMHSSIHVTPPTPIVPPSQPHAAGPTISKPASRMPSKTILYVPSIEGNLNGAGSGSSPYYNWANTASARTSYTRVGDETNDIINDEDDGPERDGEEEEESQARDDSSDSSRVPSQAEEVQPGTPVPPMATLTFLLISTRRKTMSFPPETAVGRVKELVWDAWPAEWDDPDKKPASPANIRFLHLGKILQDEDTLEQLKFSLVGPTIVHISIRPVAVPSADEYTKKKWIGSSRRDNHSDGETNGVGCCAGCIIC